MYRIRNVNSVVVDSDSASLFDDIPPAADNHTSGKRKVEDEDSDGLKRPKRSAQKCKACIRDNNSFISKPPVRSLERFHWRKERGTGRHARCSRDS